MADFTDRSLGIGYAGGSSILFLLLMLSLGVWYWSAGSVSVDTLTMPKVEMFYWATIFYRAMVIGNLGSDPVLRNLRSGQPAVGFSIATDESFTDKQGQKRERVEWHHVVAFGKLAETCNQFLKKGRHVYELRQPGCAHTSSALMNKLERKGAG
jgi:hypothetical protein